MSILYRLSPTEDSANYRERIEVAGDRLDMYTQRLDGLLNQAQAALAKGESLEAAHLFGRVADEAEGDDYLGAAKKAADLWHHLGHSEQATHYRELIDAAYDVRHRATLEWIEQLIRTGKIEKAQAELEPIVSEYPRSKPARGLMLQIRKIVNSRKLEVLAQEDRLNRVFAELDRQISGMDSESRTVGNRH